MHWKLCCRFLPYLTVEFRWLKHFVFFTLFFVIWGYFYEPAIWPVSKECLHKQVSLPYTLQTGVMFDPQPNHGLHFKELLSLSRVMVRECLVSPLVGRISHSTTVLAYFCFLLGCNGTNLITLCHWAYRSQEAGGDHYWRIFYIHIHLSFCNERRILISKSVQNRSYVSANYSCSFAFSKLCTVSCLYLIFSDEMYKNLWPEICYVLLYKLEKLLVKKKIIKCTLVQALRLCTGRTAHRGSRGIALPFHDQRH